MEKKRIYIRLVALPDDIGDAARAYGDLMAEATKLAPLNKVQFFNGNVIADLAFKKHLRSMREGGVDTASHFMIGDRVMYYGCFTGEPTYYMGETGETGIVLGHVPGTIVGIDATDDRILSYTVDFEHLGKKAIFTPEEMQKNLGTAFTTPSTFTLTAAPQMRWSITGWRTVDVNNWESIVDMLAQRTDDTIYLCGNQHQIKLISEIIAKREKFDFRYL